MNPLGKPECIMIPVYVRFSLLLVLMIAGSCATRNRSEATADDYAVYAAYMTSFGFYQNVPRRDTVLILDSTTSAVPAIDPGTPWSWMVSVGGDRCHHQHDIVRCRKARDNDWVRLFDEVKQLARQPGYKLTQAFRQAYPTRLLSREQFDGQDLPEPSGGDNNSAQYVFTFSSIVYNASGTKALFMGSFWCGDTCGRGELVMLENVDQEWKVIDTFRCWIA